METQAVQLRGFPEINQRLAVSTRKNSLEIPCAAESFSTDRLPGCARMLCLCIGP